MKAQELNNNQGGIMAHNTSSDSDNEMISSRRKLFEKPLHQVFGGGKVADLLLWKNKNVSAGVLLGMTVIWFLFEGVEYNLVTLLCHITITTMFVLFIWSTVADILKWNHPPIPENILQESLFLDLASTLYRRTNQLLQMFLYISSGSDLPHFLLVLVSLYILSVFGNYFSFVNLLYFGFLFIQTLPFVYERYGEDIDHLVGYIIMDLKRKYRMFDKDYLSRIPRGPVKEKKIR